MGTQLEYGDVWPYWCAPISHNLNKLSIILHFAAFVDLGICWKRNVIRGSSAPKLVRDSAWSVTFRELRYIFPHIVDQNSYFAQFMAINRLPFKNPSVHIGYYSCRIGAYAVTVTRICDLIRLLCLIFLCVRLSILIASAYSIVRRAGFSEVHHKNLFVQMVGKQNKFAPQTRPGSHAISK